MIIKLGIDLHGVIDSNIYKFKNYLLASREIGIHICIISGPPVSFIQEELDNYGIVNGIHFNEIFSVVDFLKRNGTKMWYDEKGRPWASDEDWWASKAKICKLNLIDIMIDDSIRYMTCFENISTKFFLYKP